MENFVANGRDRNGLKVSNVGATPYSGVWKQSKLENGRRIWWSYVSLAPHEADALGVKGWAYFLYGSEDPRACAYVSERFAENRSVNIESLKGMARPKNVDSVTWGDRLDIPEFEFAAVTSNDIIAARRAKAKAKEEVKAARPFRKARRGIGSY
jgi:hypothetical protein